MEELKTIQKIFGITKIVVSVLFVISVIAAVISAVLFVGSFFVNDINEWIFKSHIVDNEIYIGNENIRPILASSLIQSISLALLMGLSKKYLRAEQEEGTPFTFNGSDILKRNGIIMLIITLVSQILFGIVEIVSGDNAFDTNTALFLSYGLASLLLSIIFRYGAQLRSAVEPLSENNTEDTDGME